MKIKSLVLGSVATLSLAGVLFAAPVAAQYSGNPPQVSTPAEKQQTRELNQSGTDGTEQSPAALNGQAPMSDNPNVAASDQSQYNERQEQYQQQQQQYQDQKAQYRAEHHRYMHDIRRYDLARWEYTDYPHVYVYRYGDARLQRVYLVADPTHQLAQLPIEGPSGRFVGKVRNIETGPGGEPARIEVALNRVVSVWVSPGHFRYDPYEHVLFTDLTRDELWDMPGATVESDVYRD
jgi:hypothetical protein